MPVNFEIPFIPQEGQTQQVLAAIQLANSIKQHQAQMAVAQQELGLRAREQTRLEAALPSEIEERQAQTKQLQSETELGPKRLQAEIDSRNATLKLEEATRQMTHEYQMGFLGIRNKSAEAALERAHTDALREQIEADYKKAQMGGIAAQIDYRNRALSQVKDLTEQEIGLRQQANQLRAQGLENQAEAIESQADHVVNQVGVMRSFLGEIGAAPAVKTPSATTPTKPAATPSKPAIPQGATHIGMGPDKKKHYSDAQGNDLGVVPNQ